MKLFDSVTAYVNTSEFKVISTSPAATNAFELFDTNYGVGFAVEGVYGRTKFGAGYTTTPATINITDYGTVQRYINFESNGTHGYFARSSTGLTFTGLDTGDGTQFVLNSDLSLNNTTAYFKNNVGIGTTSPSNSLQIGGVGGTGTMNMNGGGGVGSTLSVRGHSATGYQFDMYNSDFSRAYFLAQQTGAGPGTDASLQMMFRTGTGSAITGYDMNGNLRVGFGSNFSGDAALLHTRQDFKTLGSDALFSWTDTLNYILIDSPKGVTEAQPFIEMVGGANGTNIGHLKFSTTQDSFIALADAGTVGNFGVGTGTPTAKLHVKAKSTSGTDFAFEVVDSSSNILIKTDNAGHTGFSADPTAAYRVFIDSTGATVNGLLVNNDSDRAIVGQVLTNSGLIGVQGIANGISAGVGVQGLTANGYGIYGSATTGVAAYGYSSGAGIAGQFEVNNTGALIMKGLGTSSAERFRVTEDGKWGIGNSAPTANVHISNASGTIVAIESSGGSRILDFMNGATVTSRIYSAAFSTYLNYLGSRHNFDDVPGTGTSIFDVKLLDIQGTFQVLNNSSFSLINASTDASGNKNVMVGNGTSDYTTMLQAAGIDNTSSNYSFKANSSVANILAVRNDHTLIFEGISSGFTGSQKYEKQDGTQTGTKSFPLVRTISTIATSSNQMVIIKGTVAGFQSNFSNSYGSTFFAVFYNNGGTLSQVSTTDLSEKFTFGGAPTTTVTTSGTNIIIQVTGVSAVLINWVATYEYTTLSSNI